jgi:4-hydroxyphenylpyruvate dioxygenase
LSADLCLWSGTVPRATFAQRLDAAVAGGFSTVSLFPRDHRAAREHEGLSDADMRALMADRGVRVATLDPFTRWLPRWEPPPGVPADRLELVGCEEARFFAIAEALGAETMTVVEPFGVRYALGELVESFAAICDRAALSGLKVHLEFIPFTGIRDIATAWEVVRVASRPNGGLAFDTWHYVRGARDDDLLAQIPGERIFVVQLNDGAREPVGSLARDSLHHRRLPGEGEWDLGDVLSELLAKDGLRSIGVETLSDELAALDPVEVGRRAGAALRATLG